MFHERCQETAQGTSVSRKGTMLHEFVVPSQSLEFLSIYVPQDKTEWARASKTHRSDSEPPGKYCGAPWCTASFEVRRKPCIPLQSRSSPPCPPPLLPSAATPFRESKMRGRGGRTTLCLKGRSGRIDTDLVERGTAHGWMGSKGRRRREERARAGKEQKKM